MIFAGMSGSATADTAALGSVLIPAMKREGYPADFSAAVTVASAMVGPIIPPSIAMVIYGALADVSIGRLLLAGILPGVTIIAVQMIFTWFLARRRGYPRYARAGLPCRHNLNYWEFGDYLAIGAGAHGKITRVDGVFRYVRPANPLQYMNAIEAGEGTGEPQPIGPDEIVFEFMLNALRLVNGFSERLFCERTGISVDKIECIMGPARAKGLVDCDAGERWRPSALGRRFLNDLQAEFLPSRR